MFQHHFPIHPSQMSRWRKRMGEKGVEKLLQVTIEPRKAVEDLIALVQTEAAPQQTIMGS